jgi:preprotein translocase subunit SecE
MNLFQKIYAFLNASYVEVTQHVTWSKYEELQSSSILVLVATFIFAVVILLIDSGFQAVLNAIYSSF